MGVAVEANASVKQLEVGVSDRRVQDVLVDVVARTCMHEQHVMVKVAIRKAPQPVQPFQSDDLNCPPHDGSGVVVEPLEDLRIRAGAVVVANERHPLAFHHLVQAVFRIAPVAHHVTQTQRLLDWRTVTKDGFKGLPIGMDVRKDCDLQAGRSYRRG